MIRHAKAPSAGPIRGKSGRAILLALALVSFMALAASPASAAPARNYQSSFGSFPGFVSAPSAVAVDQSTGEVYALSINGAEVRRFSADGSPSNFSAGPSAGTNAITGLELNGPNLDQVAIDGSGNIYITTGFEGTVQVFAHDGSHLTTLGGSSTPGGFFTEPCGVAVDQSNGDVYVSDRGNHIWRYTPSGGHAVDGDYADGATTSFTPCQLAADSGNVYVTDQENGGLFKFASSDFGSAPPSPSPSTVDPVATATAVDPATGQVYVDEGNQISVFSSTGGPLYHFGSAADFGTSSTGVAVKSGGNVYVADGHAGGRQVDVYGPFSPPVNPPTATTDPATEVHKSKVTLNGHLDPGEDAGITGCHFEWGTTVAYGHSAPCSEGSSFPAKANVSTVVNGLTPSSTYHFRLDITTTSSGEVQGADLTITTEAITLARKAGVTFGPDGTPTSSFSELGGLGFEQSSQYIFVASRPSAVSTSIFGFDASAPPTYPPLAAFSPLALAGIGSPGDVAADSTALSSAGNVYYASSAEEPGGLNGAKVHGFDSTGSPLGGSFPIEPAVPAPKGLGGVAVDSVGNVWITSFYGELVAKYSSAGTFQSSVSTASLSGGLTPVAVAFDSADNMYVAENGNGDEHGVWKLTAASGYSSATATQITAGSVPDIAVNPSNDHLLVVKAHGVSEYGSNGALLLKFAENISGSSYTGVAVDATNDTAYVADTGNHVIRVYGPAVAFPEVATNSASALSMTSARIEGAVNPQGLPLTDCHFEYVALAAFRASGFTDLSSGGSAPCSPAFASIPADLEDHEVSADVTGLDPDTEYLFRISATNFNGTSVGADVPVAGPAIVETTGSPLRTATTAQLDSRVDPRRASTDYHFEYGDEGPCDSNPCTSTPLQAVGSGDETRFVSQSISGLLPGTTYHYRVVADNGTPGGPAYGDDMTVTTRASEDPLSHGAFPGPPGSDRAWEQVSVAESAGNPVKGGLGFSTDGNRAVYGILGAIPGSQTGSLYSQFFAERTPTGWQTDKSIYPRRSQLVGSNWLAPVGSEDLSTYYAANFTGLNSDMDLWRIERNGAPTELHIAPAADFTNYLVSADGSRALMTIAGQIYDVTSGTPELASVLPNGSPSCGVVENGGASMGLSAVPRWPGWISADGSRLFFSTAGSCTGFYMRNLDTAQTTSIEDSSLSGGACPNGAFIKSTPDAVFFWTQGSLTPADTSGLNGCGSGTENADVYRYSIGSGTLKCVTCVVAHADVRITLGNYAAASAQIAIPDDGSRVYFNSPNKLLPGASPGIYRVDTSSGDLAFVAPGANTGSKGGDGNALSSDGSTLVFSSSSQLLNQVNGLRNGGTLQYYLYDDDDGSLTCASCPQDGSVPAAAVPTKLIGGEGGTVQSGPNLTPLDAVGDFAFTTPNALVAADQNTARPGQSPFAGGDVYEWRDGRLLLVSDGLTSYTGASDGQPLVMGLTPSGRDLFLTAAARWTPDAIDTFTRLYDARVGGGFDFPESPPPCPLEACQGTPRGTPEEAVPGTASFSGSGNSHPAAKHKKKHKRHHKRKHRKHVDRRAANHDRRGAR